MTPKILLLIALASVSMPVSHLQADSVAESYTLDTKCDSGECRAEDSSELLKDDSFAPIDPLWDLRDALSEGDTDRVERLIKGVKDINAQDEASRTVLIYAIIYGYSAVVDRLIAAGADLNAQDQLGRTALHWAVISGNSAMVDRLIAAGADIHAQDKDGRTALVSALNFGYSATVESLIAAGVDIYGYSAVVECLIAAGADIHVQDKDGRTALHWAAAILGNSAVVESLIAVGADIYAYSAAVESLIAAGADLNAQDKDGATALTYASEDIESLLVSKGASYCKAGRYLDCIDSNIKSISERGIAFAVAWFERNYGEAYAPQLVKSSSLMP